MGGVIDKFNGWANKSDGWDGKSKDHIHRFLFQRVIVQFHLDHTSHWFPMEIIFSKESYDDENKLIYLYIYKKKEKINNLR